MEEVLNACGSPGMDHWFFLQLLITPYGYVRLVCTEYWCSFNTVTLSCVDMVDIDMDVHAASAWSARRCNMASLHGSAWAWWRWPFHSTFSSLWVKWTFRGKYVEGIWYRIRWLSHDICSATVWSQRELFCCMHHATWQAVCPPHRGNWLHLGCVGLLVSDWRKEITLERRIF